MRGAINYFRTRSITLFAFFASDVMIEFAVHICPTIICRRNVGLSVIEHESVNIGVVCDLEILIYPMFMPYGKIYMEIFGECIFLDKFYRNFELLCVEVESEIGVQKCESEPHL